MSTITKAASPTLGSPISDNNSFHALMLSKSQIVMTPVSSRNGDTGTGSILSSNGFPDPDPFGLPFVKV